MAFVAVGIGAVVACGSPPGSSAPVRAPGASASAGGTCDAACREDQRLEAKLAEIDRIEDWRSTVWGAGMPNPPVATRARRIPERGPFRLASVAKIRAYHFRHSLTNEPLTELQGTSLDVPFTGDGRLAGHVVPPEVELSRDEQQRVLTLFEAAARRMDPASGHVASRPSFRCGFTPHHVLVFFDGADVPIGKLFVCLTCGELQMLPAMAAMGGDGPAGMAGDERTTLREILDAHGLAAWSYDEHDATRQAVFAYVERVYGPYGSPTAKGRERAERLGARPSGVPGEVLASRASKADRERLCIWLASELSGRIRYRPDGVAYGHYECESGRSYELSRDSMATCETKKLCDAPLGKIEACLRASFLDGPERPCQGPGPECDGLLDCLPGVAWGRR